jgi:hypothetical protein
VYWIRTGFRCSVLRETARVCFKLLLLPEAVGGGSARHRALKVDLPIQCGRFANREVEGMKSSCKSDRGKSGKVPAVRLAHAEVGHLIGPVLVRSSELLPPSRLPPHVREVLTCLLEGDSEKQVAGRMGLSIATVHQYVTALYLPYCVSSRAELLVRVLRRAPKPTGPTPRDVLDPVRNGGDSPPRA